MTVHPASRSARWLRRRPWLRLALAMTIPVLWLLGGIALLSPVR
ncbi:MAG: hypothetical protein U0P81_15415 [Holophagaceae bacterium]